MSTCTLLLVSHAGCGLNESLQPCKPPLQTKISNCSCRLSGESKHMGECLKCFPSSDLCQCFGERMSFVESNITKYLESSSFFKSEHTEVNMPAELCFGHSEVSEQGDPKKENQSLEHSAQLCTEQETSIGQNTIELNEADGLCIENSQINGEFLDQSGSSGFSSLLDSCSEHSECFETSSSSVELVEICQNDELSIAFVPSDQSEFSEHDAEQLTLSEMSLEDCESFQQDDAVQILLTEMKLDDCDSFEQHYAEQLNSFEMSPDLCESSQQDDYYSFEQHEAEQLNSFEMSPDLCESSQQDDYYSFEQHEAEQLNSFEMSPNLCESSQQDDYDSFEQHEAEQLNSFEMSPDLSESSQQDDYDSFEQHEAEQLNSFEMSPDLCESTQQDDYDSFEQHEAEQLNSFEMSPDLCEYYQQDAEEIISPEMSLDDCESFQQDDSEQLTEVDLRDSFTQVDVASSQFDLLDYEMLSECGAEYQEQYSKCKNISSEENLSRQNDVVELDSEDCETSKQSEPNNQNKLDEYHATHFKSPELCQDSKESKPSDHCLSLEHTQLTGQKDTTDDRVLLNDLDDCTCLSETFNCSRTSSTEGYQDYNQHFEHSESSVSFKTLEQCTSCGMHIEKCDILEQCTPSVPTDHSEGPYQSRLTENCPKLSGTHDSVFHNLEAKTKENLPNHSSRTEGRKPSECDAMFSGSMETFEARWLSQFLTDLLRHNKETSSIAAEISESNGEVEKPEVVDPKPEVQALDNCRKLCRKCEELEKGKCCNDETLQDEEATFELHSYVDISLDAVTTGAGSSDESSEEEYCDCMDAKSQSSSETDESFKSFVDESESFEIFTDQPCDKENLLAEDDEPSIHILQPDEYHAEGNKNFNMYTQENVDACEEACEIDSVRQVTEKESSKTYAEALAVGLPVDPVQIHECAKPDDVCGTDAYGPDFIDESLTLYSEAKGNDLCNINGEVAEPHVDMDVQVSCVAGVQGYELEEVVEHAFNNISGDVTGSCAVKNTFQEVDPSESPEEELLEKEVSQNLTGFYSSENKEIIQDLSSVVEIDENEETHPDFENEGAHGPCCGEIETTEDEETALFDFEDLVRCSEESDKGKETPTADQLLSCAFEEQSNTETESFCLSDGQQEAHTKPKDTSGLLHPPGTYDLPEENKQNEKLEELIHQVARSEAPEQDTFQSDQNKSSEQSDSCEDSDVSEDEQYPEDCDCEICVPPIDQVPAKPLLPQIKSKDVGKICVVIDLDETLVHSSFKPVNNADFIIPVEIDGTVHQVYVLKRPHVDEFLKRMGELFECVLFTASLAKYADPVSDLLDKWGAFRSRLFRESCVFHRGNYVKDLSRLGRDLNKVIIVDNSPASYIFHPDNAVPVASWFDDMSDTELLDLIPFFERLSKVDNVYTVLKQQRTTS
ncbi:uncharacterized protein ctdsp1 isoform X1 [Siphateles boraxobius]|uniref:uncharacterized protein ctdsp1 isoform X1 n=1 Tax=Siphateles boraxobius TaxID=180520 RepID=UPI0040628663